ncbi:MAG TPA: CPBP family intramembrane glutamic endopeptidase [Phycisphaerae bacterium]|nr:CPBP family intramembrane glutamic endopeptidase [Phycisphaerae bacterium]
MTQGEPVSPIPPATRDAGAVGRPWGFWATFGFSVIVMMVQVAAAVPVTLLFAAVIRIAQPEPAAMEALRGLAANGLYLSVVLLVSTPPCVGLIVLLAWVRRQVPVGRYLGLGFPSAWRTAGWLGATVLFAAAATGVAVVVPDPMGAKLMLQMYETSVFPPLMIVAFVLAAPLFEEFLFRGFLFEGIRRSRLGVVGAVVISSAVWAAIHLHYGWISIGVLLCLGFLLSAARLRTESVWICFLMHAVFNLISMVQVMVAVHA